MQSFIGVKQVYAKPMNRGEYNVLRGWKAPEDKNPLDDGYLVEYIDGGQANHVNFHGYISWSPQAVFENAYRSVTGLSYGLAIEALKKGYKVARLGWNGKGQWVVLMSALFLPPYSSQTPGAKVNDRTAKHIGDDTPLESQPYFVLWNAQQKWQPGWVASTSDTLADDWFILP